MAFPLTPSNGQTTIVNGVTYQYNSTYNTWTVVAQPLPAYTGNIGNINLGTPDITFYGNIIPGTTNLYTVGNSSLSWANVTSTNAFHSSNLQVGTGQGGLLFRTLVGGTGAAIYNTNLVPSAQNYVLTTNGAALNLNAPSGGGVYTGVNNSIITTVQSGTPSATQATGQSLVVSNGLGVTGDSYFSANLGVGGIINSAGNIFAYVQNSAAATYITSNVSGYQIAQTINTGLGSLAIGFGTNTQPGGFMTIAATGGKNSINAGSARDFYIQTSLGVQAIYVTDANGNVTINSTTSSTSNTTGALTVKGGAGVAGNLSVGGNVGIGVGPGQPLLAVNDNSATGTGGVVFLGGASGSPVLQLGRSVGGTGNIYFNFSGSWPTMQYLSSGTYMATAYNGSYYSVVGGGTPGGVNDYLQVWKANGNVVVSANTISTSNVTGALVVNGGIGVSGNIYGNSRVGFVYANSVSSVYTTFNQATASYDIVFG